MSLMEEKDEQTHISMSTQQSLSDRFLHWFLRRSIVTSPTEDLLSLRFVRLTIHEVELASFSKQVEPASLLVIVYRIFLHENSVSAKPLIGQQVPTILLSRPSHSDTFLSRQHVSCRSPATHR